MPLLVASGVTSVRDMGSNLADIARWKQERAAGGPVPRILSPGPKLEGAGGRLAAAVDAALACPDERYLATAASARDTVDELKSRGVDFIKVHNRLSRAVFEAVAKESQKVGLFFAGHVLPEVGALEAAAAGQRTIEHGHGMLPCSAQDRARMQSDQLSRVQRWCAPAAVQSELLTRLARARTWFTPTLTSWRGKAIAGDPELPRLLAGLDGHEHVWPGLERHWQAMIGPVPSSFERELLSRFPPLAAAADRAGVHLLAGTDSGDPYVIPGFALHDELELLVQAGIPPGHALASTTSEPARAFGLDDELGAIGPGRAADLVVLGGDPTMDIRSTRSIEAVVLNGRWISREELQALLRR
jgi:imidazolonepropionase-like amidohydrolase